MALAILPVTLDTVPRPAEGSKACLLSCPWSGTAPAAQRFNLLQQFQTGQFTTIQAALVDNSLVPFPVVIECLDTGFNLNIPAFTQGMYPLLVSNAPSFSVALASGNNPITGVLTTSLWLLNTPQKPWSVSFSSETAITIAGTVPVSIAATVATSLAGTIAAEVVNTAANSVPVAGGLTLLSSLALVTTGGSSTYLTPIGVAGVMTGFTLNWMPDQANDALYACPWSLQDGTSGVALFQGTAVIPGSGLPIALSQLISFTGINVAFSNGLRFVIVGSAGGNTGTLYPTVSYHSP